MNPKHVDPVIDEVRAVRQRISERFGHDPAKLVAFYIRMQEKYRDRLLGANATQAAPEEGRTVHAEPTR